MAEQQGGLLSNLISRAGGLLDLHGEESLQAMFPPDAPPPEPAAKVPEPVTTQKGLEPTARDYVEWVGQHEMQGYPNPWRRTAHRPPPGKVSTAFGPAQLTRQTILGLKDLSEEVKEFRNYLAEEQRKSERPGSDDRYHYSDKAGTRGLNALKGTLGWGEAGLSSEEKELYWQLAEKVWEQKAKEQNIDLNELDIRAVDKMFGAWYGNSIPRLNKEYAKKVMGYVPDRYRKYLNTQFFKNRDRIAPPPRKPRLPRKPR